MIAVIAGGDEDRGTDVREQMTRSAALLFGERGFSGTGLRDVIAHSSTPRGSIYHHFAGGKAELAREAVRHAAGGGRGSAWPTRRAAAIRSRRCMPGSTTGAVRWSAATSARAARCSPSRSNPRSRRGRAPPRPRPSKGWADAFAATLHGAGVKRKKAARLATLTVAAIEGAVAVSRARGDTLALDQVGARARSRDRRRPRS